jgi:aerobic-type carbon monoxide dehydrogenase small subunit (CoxS/CutS family)
MSDEQGRGSKVSRRSFIKGLGTGAAGAAVLGGGALENGSEAEAAAAAGGRTGPGPARFTLNINGENRALQIEPRTTLLNALRNHLDLTGAKLVCDRGSCGACTVHVDGKPVYSCMMLAVDAQGKKITTVEGLGTPEKMDPVQAAFVENDALMCGFCTPGFVMSVRALLNKNPRPTLEQVKAACDGNLCRCGTYPRVFDAALAAAGVSSSARRADAETDEAWGELLPEEV